MISQTKQKGFTIVELLIVIVIIGILAAISIVAYNSITQRARDTERATTAGNIAKAIVNYNADQNGVWLTAGDINTDSSKLKDWKDPEISLDTLKKVRETAPDKDHFQLTQCTTTPTGATAPVPSGAKVSYYKEAKPSEVGVVKVGTGC